MPSYHPLEVKLASSKPSEKMRAPGVPGPDPPSEAAPVALVELLAARELDEVPVPVFVPVVAPVALVELLRPELLMLPLPEHTPCLPVHTVESDTPPSGDAGALLDVEQAPTIGARAASHTGATLIVFLPESCGKTLGCG